MAWSSENAERPAKTNLDMETNNVNNQNGEPGKDSCSNGSDKVLMAIRPLTLRGNPPALIRNSSKTESFSDAELSDFSLNDTEEDEEEFRNCVLLNGSQAEGKFL